MFNNANAPPPSQKTGVRGTGIPPQLFATDLYNVERLRPYLTAVRLQLVEGDPRVDVSVEVLHVKYLHRIIMVIL